MVPPPRTNLVQPSLYIFSREKHFFQSNRYVWVVQFGIGTSEVILVKMF